MGIEKMVWILWSSQRMTAKKPEDDIERLVFSYFMVTLTGGMNDYLVINNPEVAGRCLLWYTVNVVTCAPIV
jgi:hypothetical protein